MYVLQIITSRERERANQTHTHSWRIQDEEKRKIKNLQKQTKAHIAMWRDRDWVVEEEDLEDED